MSARNKFLIVLAVIVGLSAIYYLASTPRSSDLVLIGTVDSNQIIVSPQMQGRIAKLLVDEGTQVKQGDLIAVLDPSELEAQARAAAAMIDSLRSQVSATQATKEATQGSTTSNVANAQARLQSSRAQLLQAEATLQRTESDSLRMIELARQRVASDQDRVQAESNLKAQQATVQSLKDQVVAAQADLNAALANTHQAHAAESTVQSTRAQTLGVETLVFQAVALAYLDVVRDQTLVEVNRNNEQVLRRQLEATQDRFRVGEVTRTDVAQAESALAQATATRITSEGTLEISRSNYARAVGHPPGRLVQPRERPVLPATREEALALATHNNPNVISANFTELAARDNIDVVRGQLLPTISVVGDLSRNISYRSGDRSRGGSDGGRISGGSGDRSHHGRDRRRISAGDPKRTVIVFSFVGIVIERQNRKVPALPDVPVFVIERAGPGCRVCQPSILRQPGSPHRVADGARAVDPHFVFGASVAGRGQPCRYPAEILVDRAADVAARRVVVHRKINGAAGRLTDCFRLGVGADRVGVARPI